MRPLPSSAATPRTAPISAAVSPVAATTMPDTAQAEPRRRVETADCSPHARTRLPLCQEAPGAVKMTRTRSPPRLHDVVQRDAQIVSSGLWCPVSDSASYRCGPARTFAAPALARMRALGKPPTDARRDRGGRPDAPLPTWAISSDLPNHAPNLHHGSSQKEENPWLTRGFLWRYRWDLNPRWS